MGIKTLSHIHKFELLHVAHIDILITHVKSNCNCDIENTINIQGLSTSNFHIHTK